MYICPEMVRYLTYKMFKSSYLFSKIWSLIDITTLTSVIQLHVYVLRASKSPFADMLEEYVNAEQTGQENGHGECWRYYKACPKSLFVSPQENKYL